MKKFSLISVFFILITGCSTAYVAKPLPFKTPTAYNNAVNAAGAQIAAKAFTNPEEATQAFGFDIIGAGMLPVQVVFDNKGPHRIEVNGQQSFLEDRTGNLWPILSAKTANERATKYSQTKEIFKEGAYKGLIGAAAGAIVGTAVGIVTGGGVGESLGKGAAVGAAAGTVIGGTQGALGTNEAQKSITSDIRDKSLQNIPIEPGSLANGFLFFPGEAAAASSLRIQIIEKDTGKIHNLNLTL